MDIKAFFVEELKRVYSQRIAAAARAEADATLQADRVKADARRREDAKEAALQGRLATGHRKRRLRAVSQMERLLQFAEGGRKHAQRGMQLLFARVPGRFSDPAPLWPRQPRSRP